ncbi:MAG: PDZ domain-containing protein [Candidatus Omnitrophica bacterium]|nr:PDZ domain-containing protein [Candidatus Omnitrophota bacterium]
MAPALTWFLAVVLVAVAAPVPACADTIYLKGKKSLKGVIVDEQADRYLLNTADGELEVLKALTQAVQYDDPELSYYQLGRQLQRAGRLREAYAAYQQATDLRPDFHAAREAAFTVQRLLSRQDESQVVNEVRQRQIVLERAGRPVAPTLGTAAPSPAAAPTFEERFGCRLRYDEGRTVVTQVQRERLAGVAGLQAGDEIVALWNDPIRRLAPDAISQRLNDSRGELALTIERTVLAPAASIQLTLGYDGLRVAAVPEGSQTGLALNDLLIAINGRPARYLDLGAAKQLLGARADAQVVIQRALVLREHFQP